MIIPVILVLAIIMFLVGVLLIRDEELAAVVVGTSVLVFGATVILSALVIGPYLGTKSELSVIDDRVILVEQTNNQKIESVIPVLEKYPQLEKDIIGGINPNAFAVLGDVYPELKSNDSYNQQAKLILDNLEELKKLESSKIDLRKSVVHAQYYLWFLN
jgi:multisubunit Na+/H+ antiporter MnhC subunit